MLPQIENNFEPQKPPRNPVFLITLTVLLVLAGAFGFWYFSNPLPVEEPEVLAKVNQFADWKTYRNEEYGFEFKYPTNWYLENYFEFGVESLAISNYPDAVSFDLGTKPTDLEQIFVGIHKKNVLETLDSLKPDYKDNVITVKSFDKVMFNGTESRKLVIYSSDHPVGDYTSFLFLKDNLEIAFNLGIDSQDEEKLLVQILSTFKFISTTTPAN